MPHQTPAKMKKVSRYTTVMMRIRIQSLVLSADMKKSAPLAAHHQLAADWLSLNNKDASGQTERHRRQMGNPDHEARPRGVLLTSSPTNTVRPEHRCELGMNPWHLHSQHVGDWLMLQAANCMPTHQTQLHL